MPITGAGNPTGGTAGVGKGLNYIGDHAFAYSDSITPTGGASADTVALQFATGSGYIVAKVQASCTAVGNEDRYTDILFNNQAVVKLKADGAPDFYDLFPIRIIVPPYTNVIIKVGEVGSAPFNVQFTGRVYE